MLTLTSPGETWSHRIPAGPKMTLLCAWGAVLFSIDSPLPLLAAILAIIALTLTCGTTFARLSLLMLGPLWPFVVIVGLWHLWTQDLSGGATVLLRLSAALMAANFVTMTTRLSDMIAVITRLSRPLAVFGLKPRVLALSIALVIRFVPVMLLRLQTIRESFRARSARRPGWRVVIPLLLAALDDAEQVAEALRARGGAG